MKRIISVAILTIQMASTTIFVSCGNENDLLPEVAGTSQSVTRTWVEPYHVKNASIDEVKAFMQQSMKNYQLVSESTSNSSIQLVYATGQGKEGMLYSFTKNEGKLYSVIDSESITNKSVVLDYLNAHYSVITELGCSDADIQYTYTNSTKSILVTTQKVTEEEFNVTYIFVTK